MNKVFVTHPMGSIPTLLEVIVSTEGHEVQGAEM